MSRYGEALFNLLKDNPKSELTTTDIHKSIVLLQEAIFKANMFDKLSSDLGCPLEVFFKILKARNYYFEYNGKVYYNKKCYINTVNVDDGFISVSVSNKELRNKYIFDVKLFFNEHKKTWWLSETKEE